MKFEAVRIYFLSDVSGLLSSKNYATIATWRKDLQFDKIWRITNQSETFSHTIVLLNSKILGFLSFLFFFGKISLTWEVKCEN